MFVQFTFLYFFMVNSTNGGATGGLEIGVLLNQSNYR